MLKNASLIVEVDLLGRCDFVFRGASVLPKSKKAAVLLVYLLARSPRSISRSDLAQIFWPKADAQAARTSLRGAIFELNKALGAVHDQVLKSTTEDVSVTKGTCQFSHLSIVDQLSSVSEILALSERVTKSEDLFPNTPRIGEDFDDWFQGFRKECFDDLIARLETRLEGETVGSPFCLALSRYLYQLDPYNEFALRILMESHDKIGESPTAIRLYDAHFEMVEAEMGIEPSIETQKLAVAIKSRVLETSVTAFAEARGAKDTSLLAVLPFECASGVKSPEVVSQAMLEELTCLLSTLSAPAVISANSTRSFDSATSDAADFGRSLGAGFVLSGRVHALDQNLRIVVELCDTTNKRIVFARSYMTEQPEIFRALPEVSERIVKHIVPSLHSEELTKIQNWSDTSLEANHLYLRSRQLMVDPTREAANEAIRLLEQSIEKDPEHAPSHTLLAEWSFLKLQQGWASREGEPFAEIERLALRSCNLSSNEGRARAMLGHMQWTVRQDSRSAMGYIEDALKTLPNDAETMIWSVPSLAYLGDPKRGIVLGERAMSLSPSDPFSFRNEHFLGIAYYAAGDYEKAAEVGLSSLARAKRYLSNLRLTIAALTGGGQHDRAAELVKRHNELCPDFDFASYSGFQMFRDAAVRANFTEHLTRALTS